jgi:hypothetical protein
VQNPFVNMISENIRLLFEVYELKKSKFAN